MTNHSDERAEWARICGGATRITVEASTLGLGERLGELRSDGGTLAEWLELLADVDAAKKRVDGHITKGDGVRRRRLLAADEGGYGCPTERCDRHEPWTPVGGTPRCGLWARPMTEI